MIWQESVPDKDPVLPPEKTGFSILTTVPPVADCNVLQGDVGC